MDQNSSGGRVRGGVLLLGLALAAVLAAMGYRSLDSAPEVDAAAEATPIERLEARVAEAPEDAEAWQELGFARFQASEFGGAATAYRKAVALDPDQAVLWSALGEALVMDSRNDPLPESALAAFRKALALDRQDPRARYFLAVERDLKGDHAGAIDAWLALLADTPRGAPWETDLARTIEQVGRINKIDVSARLAKTQAERGGSAAATASPSVATAAIPGLSAAQIAEASSIPPGQQRQMAEGMVASLEGKLAANPSNLDGWVMLMRSRVTLGQPDLARQALRDAVAANPSAATRLRQEAEALGIR